MGKFTKNYRQTKQSRTGSQSASNYAKIQRIGSWYQKIKGYISVRGKSRPEM